MLRGLWAIPLFGLGLFLGVLLLLVAPTGGLLPAVGAASAPAGPPPWMPPAPPAATATPACGPAWQLLPSPNQGSNDNYLESLAPVAPDDVWAVGDYNSGGGERTLIEHWTGSAWSVVPSPNVGTGDNHLYGVAAAGPRDVWAVGTYLGAGAVFQTLILHWDGSGWQIVPSPNQGPGWNVLIRVAAVGPGDLWAVGYWRDAGGQDHTLTEHWTGSAWSVVPSPDGGTRFNYLEGVAGGTSTDVWAVGLATTDNTFWSTLALHWDGSGWSVISSPNPGVTGNFFLGVTVVAPDDVWAVGNYHHYSGLPAPPVVPTAPDPQPQVGAAPGVSGPDYTLTEHWDGSRWSVVPSPNAGTASYLRSVTARAGNDVWAVNHAVTGSTDQTLTLHWDGSGWSVVPSPNRGGSPNQLRAVAAGAGGTVWAVGYAATGQVNQTLTAQYAAACAGTASPTPPLPTANSTPPGTPTPPATATPACAPHLATVASPNAGPGWNVLGAVAARTASDIWAVGDVGTDQVYRTLITHWDGTAWWIVPSPNRSSTADWLSAVASVSASDVWAAGGYEDSAGETQLALVHWDGSTWQAVPAPSPSGAQAASLNGLAALSATDVWAVGSYYTPGYWRTLILHWNGSTWSLVPSPNPVPSGDAALNQVAAAGPNDVWAVGATTYDTSTPNATLVEHWNGSNWSLVPAVNFANEDAAFTALSVVAPGDLWAVGTRGNASLTATLVEHWNGATWSVVPSPNQGTGSNVLATVAGSGATDLWAAGYDVDTSTYGGAHEALLLHWDGTAWSLAPGAGRPTYQELYALAALTASNVWAVGSDRTAGDYATLTQQWDGTAWQRRPSPSGGAGNNTLAGVAALSAQEGWAVGSKSSGTLTLHWDGQQWQEVASPNAPSGRSRLAAVAARAPDDVWAVGSYSRAPVQFPLGTLVEHWDGSAWSVVPSPDLGPDGDNELTGVAIGAASDIWAVGEYHNSTTVRTLIEHWDGRAWQLVPSPTPAGATEIALTGVAVVGAADAWAVGYASVGGSDQTLTLHWDGAGWSLVPSPNPGGAGRTNQLSGVAARAGNDVWAVGSYVGGSPLAPLGLTLHWDGSAWTVIAAAAPAGGGYYYFTGVAVGAAARVWAVGSVANVAPLLEYWDGQAWRGASGDGAAGGILAAVAGGGAGDGWAVGLQGTTLIQHTLVQRIVDPCPGPTATPGPSETPSPPTGTATATPLAASPTPGGGGTSTPRPAPSATPTGAAVTATGTAGGSPTPSGGGTATPPPAPSPTPPATGPPTRPPAATASATATAVLARPTATAPLCSLRFSDVQPSDYFYTPVRYLACQGVIAGYADGTFRPYANTTRGQMVKIVVLGFGLPLQTPATPTFADVPASAPFYAVIETAVARGIVSGYADGTFRPNAQVTRGQLSKIAVGAAGWPLRTPPTPTFSDVPVGSAFYGFVETAVCHGVVSGYADGTFRPGANATRGQISKIVYLAVTSPPGSCATALHR